MNPQEARIHLEQMHEESFGWALHVCSNDRSLAEDVLQTAYLKILEGKALYEERSEFKTWLFAVIRNTAREQFRKRRWNLFFSFDDRNNGSMAESQTESDFDRATVKEFVLRALETLSSRQREVLHLVFYQDMSLTEAADILRISIGSARTHYERGKRRIRKWMEESNVIDEY